MIFYEKYMDISEEILRGFKENKPILGFDSKIIKDFKFPENLNKIYEIEDRIRELGGVPAMIAVLNGRIKVGISKNDLEILCKMSELPEASKKDIPYLILKNKSGVLSFDSTLLVGTLAGIKVFLTGYLVCDKNSYNHGEYVYKDISEYLSKNIAIISCGIRSEKEMKVILDELDKYDVPLIGYQLDEIPLYDKGETMKVNYKIEIPSELLKFMKIKWELDITGGVMIINEDMELNSKNTLSWDNINLYNLFNNIRLGIVLGKEVYRIR